MALTLIINPGSSSKKFALFSDRTLIFDAYVEKHEDGFEMCTAIKGVQQSCQIIEKNNFKESLQKFLEAAQDYLVEVDLTLINKVVVRVVAPGNYFQQHRLVDNFFIQELKKIANTAPLHAPLLLQEIEAIKKLFPKTPLVAASDSYFHHTLPEYVRRYSIPADLAKECEVYHFGYHGLSVSSVLRRLKQVSKRAPKRLIVCHIGSGVSVTAVLDGQSIETTMGYAPGSGLIMGSRAGDVPTSALLAIMQAKNLRPTDALVFMQTNGGLRALTGESDLRILLDRKAGGDQAAILALASFSHHIQKAIGGYIAILGGVDAVIFTATAGERSPALRSLILSKLTGLDIHLDEEKNAACVSRDGVISHSDDKVEVLVIKTNEAEEMLYSSESF